MGSFIKVLDFHSFRINVFYDQSFVKTHGNQSANALRRTLAQAQGWFRHPSHVTRFTLQAPINAVYVCT
jgi:hypothetical protein